MAAPLFYVYFGGDWCRRPRSFFGLPRGEYVCFAVCVYTQNLSECCGELEDCGENRWKTENIILAPNPASGLDLG